MTAAGSERGDREHQEDGWLAVRRDGAVLCAVCDGMGAATSGRPAADLVLATLHRTFWSGEPAAAVLDALGDANREILRCAELARRREPGCDPRWLGMGTTAEVAIFVDGWAHLAHVGDGRIYRLREEELEALTIDHTLVNDHRRLLPDLTEEELQEVPQNVIVRALGMREDIEIDRFEIATLPGDVFLLCTDALSAGLDDTSIGAVLRRRMEAPALVRALLDAALAAPCAPGRYRDGVTAVVHRVG